MTDLPPATRGASRFLLAQASLTAVWWVAMILRPDWRTLFFAEPSIELAWLPYLLPDAILYIGLAIVCAIGFMNGKAFSWPCLLVHTGAVGYATFHAIAQSGTTGKGWLGALAMLATFIVLLWLIPRTRPK